MKFYAALADQARHQYNREYAAEYRVQDDLGVHHISHADLCELLSTVSDSWNRPISVLDLGCGTGRYFHCLKNLQRLTGVDVSLEMLNMARHPIMSSKILSPINLVCANMAAVSFAPQSFDLIYCIGVIGDFFPLDSFILDKVWSMLKNDGKFIFTMADKRSPQATSWKRIMAYAIRTFLPFPFRRQVNARLRSFRLTEQELRSTMDHSQFINNQITRRYSATGRIDLICISSMR